MVLKTDLMPRVKILSPLALLIGVFLGIGLNRILGLWENPTTHVLGLFIGISLFAGIIIKPEISLWAFALLRSSVGALAEATTVFPGAWNININGILNLLIIFGGIYHIITKRINFSKLSISKPYIVFMLICFTSILFTPDKITALRYCVRFLSYFMLYVVTITALQNKKQIVNLIRVIFLSAIVPLSVGFYQIFTSTGNLGNPGFNRIFATFAHPVPYGYYLMLIFPFAVLFFLFHSTFGITKYIWGFICLLLGASLIGTYARGAWIGTVVALAVIGLHYKRVLVLLPLLLILLVVLLPSISGRLEDVSVPINEQSSSFTWRINLWKEVFPMIKAKPLFGNGLGSFESSSSVMVLGTGASAHNVYLRLAMETGLLGLGAYLWILLALGINAVKGYTSAADKYIKTLNLGFISILAAYVLVCVADNHLSYVHFQWYFWFFAAIVESSRRIDANISEESLTS